MVAVDDYFDGIYAQERVRPRVSVSVYVCVSLYDPRVYVRFSHCYLHRELQLAFSTPDLVYDAVVCFPLFHRFSIVIECGIWLSYFMIITFYRNRRVFALTFKNIRANARVTMKFHIQYKMKKKTKKLRTFSTSIIDQTNLTTELKDAGWVVDLNLGVIFPFHPPPSPTENRPQENQLAIGKPVTFPLLDKEKVYKCKMGKTFMVILPGLSVVVEFCSRFNFRGEKGKSHFLMLTTTQTLRCRHLSQYFHVGLMAFNTLMPSGVVNPYQLDLSIFSFKDIWCIFSFLRKFRTEIIVCKQCRP